jgi:hypothetical protein
MAKRRDCAVVKALRHPSRIRLRHRDLIDHLFACGGRGRQAGKDCLDLVGRQPVIDDEIAAPKAEIVEDDQPEPLLTTDDDIVEATQKLVASKNLEDGPAPWRFRCGADRLWSGPGVACCRSLGFLCSDAIAGELLHKYHTLNRAIHAAERHYHGL